MRVNVYAEEMTQRVEKEGFTGIRFYLYLPVTDGQNQIAGPFMHKPDDDDSAAVTFWGKRELRGMLKQALALIDDHATAEEQQQAENDERERDGRSEPSR